MPQGLRGFQKGNTFGNRCHRDGDRGDKNHNWRGGRRLNSGYVPIYEGTQFQRTNV